MTERLRVTAKVEVTIEVVARSSWGPECSVAQVHKQAIVDAQALLTRIFTNKEAAGRVSILGTPRAKAISTEVEQS